MINHEILKLPPLKLRMRADLTRTILRGHAWVYQNALKEHKPGKPGQRAKLFDKPGKRQIAEGYYDPTSPIRLRICKLKSDDASMQALLKRKLRSALLMRMQAFSLEQTNAFRLVNGPGDGLPGLVIDKYAHTAVIRLDGSGAEAFWDVNACAEILLEAADVSSVYQRFKVKGKPQGRWIVGGGKDAEAAVVENSLKFVVNFKEGQKTGFFLDQRDSRQRIQPFCKDRSVLNVFGYTGGFSVYAGAAGAKSVTTVDLAGPALELADRNWAINQLPADAHTSIKQDAFAYLDAQRIHGKEWDIVILDPPSYVHSEKHLAQGKNAYQKLIAAGASVIKDGGILCASSCSSHINSDTFLSICEDGVSKARKRAAVLGNYGQPEDHPAPLVMPEMRYLKFVILKILA